MTCLIVAGKWLESALSKVTTPSPPHPFQSIVCLFRGFSSSDVQGIVKSTKTLYPCPNACCAVLSTCHEVRSERPFARVLSLRLLQANHWSVTNAD
jgi:hypothetical protein